MFKLIRLILRLSFIVLIIGVVLYFVSPGFAFQVNKLVLTEPFVASLVNVLNINYDTLSRIKECQDLNCEWANELLNATSSKFNESKGEIQLAIKTIPSDPSNVDEVVEWLSNLDMDTTCTIFTLSLYVLKDKLRKFSSLSFITNSIGGGCSILDSVMLARALSEVDLNGLVEGIVSFATKQFE